ncbi:DNA alkylation repair protein [Arsenicicoccus sp. MKL-02]|uniref:DNA alkylation repair protein n=1 Tax=Arsenicicoccus cauae TaxID=2663847 RepID=A0A6I3IRD8_9MICO|nr:DNA alkylation repair protein [Arsenicicoccus cauae]MTB72510.1 DNA alkylation repair protein [Arsenicicoccus cauae]
MSDADTLVAQVRAALAAHADPERAAGQQRYMRSAMPFHGLTTPQRRLVTRPILAAHRLATREEWEATIRRLWDEATHREERYTAIELLRHRAYRGWRDTALAPLLEHLITTGAWWDVVDATTPVVGEILRAEPGLASQLREWSRSDDLWLRRASIIGQLDSKGRTDVALLQDCLDANLGDREVFIRKAIGWALRQHARVDPTWVRTYVATRRTRLSPLSVREALKHLGDA